MRLGVENGASMAIKWYYLKTVDKVDYTLKMILIGDYIIQMFSTQFATKI